MKKLLAVLLFITCTLSFGMVYAEEEGVSVSFAAGSLQENGAVEIKVEISNTKAAEPGIIGIAVSFTFDEEAFELIPTENETNIAQDEGSVVKATTDMWIQPEGKNGIYTFVFGDRSLGGNMITKDGVLGSFSLKAKEGIEKGEYPITIVEDKAFPCQMTKINADATSIADLIYDVEKVSYNGTSIEITNGAEEKYPADILEHWGKEAIEKVIDAGIMNGYEDGTFLPDGTISRAEFAVVLARFLKIEPGAGKTFDDAKGHWAEGYISAMADKGYVNGISETTFGCNDPITREQIASVLSRAQGYEDISQELFADDNAISNWAKEHVYKIKQALIMGGDTEGNFRPKDSAKRAEIATILSRLLK